MLDVYISCLLVDKWFHLVKHKVIPAICSINSKRLRQKSMAKVEAKYVV